MQHNTQCTCGLNAHNMTEAEIRSLTPADYVDTIERVETYCDPQYGMLQDVIPVGEKDGRCESCRVSCNAAENGSFDFQNQVIAEAVAMNLDTFGGWA